MSTSRERTNPTMEFHISRRARDRYQLDESLFSLQGNIIFANFKAARTFAQKLNAQRENRPVNASDLTALGLIDEIFHFLIAQYRLQKNPQVMEKALHWLKEAVGTEEVEKTLVLFADTFPPLPVYRQEVSPQEYLHGETAGVPNQHLLLEELLLLWLANNNPAAEGFRELFDDRHLADHTAYTKVINQLEAFFETQPRFGPHNLPLIDFLRAPVLASPHSFSGQLAYIRENWGYLVGKYMQLLLRSIDLIKEEQMPRFDGPGPSRVPQFTGDYIFEEEHFTPDRDWMPQLVLLAKNAYVWLDQLSKEYHRPVSRLDQVPDEELNKLQRWGITGLWLIGIWKRSPASQRIKQLCGNPDAVASAYSIYDYVIDDRLGGEEAYENLRDRAWQRGIRLAADMVPNHVGIYSRWVVEHPDWFISLDYSPFPSYSFNGENLSEDDRVEIYLEDHYYTREDAAVVFKRVDRWTREEKYIYHGNDGTSMPWNDTAQLNYLNPAVREAVIQTILHVARKFSIIRFDAAMTLAKKHYQRLWFPEPGTGGDIPSRAEFGMTREQFDAAFPVEFWREVVDRVRQEAPDTLLLAEAFWMMEGYFVRTLGMHRVYNSAFMNMLRDEKNDEYRQLIKNTLEFDPDILKRYVNFMSNPDERTAMDQFGKGGKYFGVCTLMVTLPGLPMFGHGQIEGYEEKYGMEFYRAYLNEQPDRQLIRRHEREIFPLLHRRSLFAGVDNFLLYDFFTPEGIVNEDVFAFSNRLGDPASHPGSSPRALVVYHNKWAETRGWIKTSAAHKDKLHGDEGLIQRELAEGLALRKDANTFTIFRDHISGLEYIRNNLEIHEQGLYFELKAYQYQVFLDFREVSDNDWRQYHQLAEHLQGRGVPSMEEALREFYLQPIHYPFKEIVNPGFFQWLIDNRSQEGLRPADTLEIALDEARAKLTHLFRGIAQLTEGMVAAEPLIQEVMARLEASLQLPSLGSRYPQTRSRKFKTACQWIIGRDSRHSSLSNSDPQGWGTLLGWLFTHKLGFVLPQGEAKRRGRDLLHEWRLEGILVATFEDMGFSPWSAWNTIDCIKGMITHQDWYTDRTPKRSRAYRALQSWFEDQDVGRYLKLNRHNEVLWFNKEAMESWLQWMLTVATIATLSDASLEPDEVIAHIASHYDVINKIYKALPASGYQVEKLIQAVR